VGSSLNGRVRNRDLVQALGRRFCALAPHRRRDSAVPLVFTAGTNRADAVRTRMRLRRADAAEGARTMVNSRKGGAMAATDDLDVRVQRVESKIDALGVSVDEMSAEHRDHTTFAVERLATELRERFDGVDTRFDGVDTRFDGVDARFNAVDARFNAVDARFDIVDSRLERIEAKFDAVQERIDSVDARFRTVLARFDGSDARLETIDVRFTRLERKVDRILDHLLPGATADTRRRP